MVRGTWLLVALPLLLAAFTIGRPQPLPPPVLPPVFDEGTAETLARELARDYPDRSPGSAGALGAAAWVEEQLTRYGFEAHTDVFRAEIPGRGRVELRNIATVVPGSSQRAIVVTAHRDSEGEGLGANDNASGTAALIELARAYASVAGSRVQTRPANTLVFVSTDGGAYGALGAARYAQAAGDLGGSIAVISLDAIGGTGPPRLLIGGDTARSPAATLVQSAALRVLEETGAEPEHASALRQLVALGFPFTLGEQGPFVARGIPAVTLTTLPETPADGFTDTALSADRLGQLGRAAQNLVASLDAGLELAQGTTSYVYLGPRLVRGWAIELVLLTALLPFAIGAIDLFARCRRRRIPLLPAVLSLRTRLLFWGFAAAAVAVAGLLGALPDGEPRPLPAEPSLYIPSPLVLVGLGVLVAAGWLVARERLLPHRRVRVEETLAGHTVALLFLLPSLYAWLWLPQAQAGAPASRAILFVLGLTGALLVVLPFATRLELGWTAPWYLLALVTNGYVSWLALLLAVVWLAIASQLAALASGRYAPYAHSGRPPGAAARFGRRRAPLAEVDALEG